MEIINNAGPAPAPAVADCYGLGWETLKKYFPELLLLLFIELLLSVPAGLTSWVFSPFYPGPTATGILTFLWWAAVLMPVGFGTSWVFLKAVRREAFRVQDIFFAYQQFWNVLLANLLMGLVIGLGFVLLIVPGIIFACKLAFVPYLVMDRRMDAVEAVRTSWQMTSGHAGTIFLMGVTAVFVVIAGLIVFLVGVIPAGIWVSLAFAAMYHAVDSRQPAPPSV